MIRLPKIATSDRVVLFGNSGEGKSTLARALLIAKPDVIVIDTKRDPKDRWDLVGEIVHGEDIRKVGGGRFVWQPPNNWMTDMEYRDDFFHWALGDPDNLNGNRVIYLDKILHTAPSATKFPIWLQLCVQTGRSANLGIWGTTQMPVRVPLFTIANAEYVFTFAVGLPEYRQRIDEIIEDPVPWSEIPRRSHKFMFRTPGGFYGPFELDLEAYNEQVARANSAKAARTGIAHAPNSMIARLRR